MCYSGNNTQPAQKSRSLGRSLAAGHQPLPQKANLRFTVAALTEHMGETSPWESLQCLSLHQGAPRKQLCGLWVSITGQGPGFLCEFRKLTGFLSDKRGLYRNGNRECSQRREGLGVSIGTPWGLLSLPQEAFNTSPAGGRTVSGFQEILSSQLGSKVNHGFAT